MQNRLLGASSPQLAVEKTRAETFGALPPRLGSGDVLGQFRIDHEIAGGATATVYEARRSSPPGRVALKVLSAHLGLMAPAVARFQLEHALTGKVEHPSILPVYETGQALGHHYYAMRLESGATAEQLSLEAAGERDEAFFRSLARLFAPVAQALDRLHRKGIVHRDVKPDNLLVGRSGELILCDFGSALDPSSHPAALERGLWGTLRYMSPEQFLAGANARDRAMDIYALGLTLYELATGVSPFPLCSEEDLVRLKLTRLPAPPRRINHKVPLALDAVIRQAIEANPRLRYQAAGAFGDDLERLAAGKRGHRR